MQLKGTELLTISSLFKNTSESSHVCLWRNILICYFHCIDSTSVAVCRQAFVIGPYSHCMDLTGPRSIYLPTRSSQQKVLFPFDLLQPIRKIKELKQHKH